MSPRRQVVKSLYEAFEKACKRQHATLAEALITSFALLRRPKDSKNKPKGVV
jgi:hypothetical protein